MDRGDSYRVKYVGSAMLSKMATGLGVLQKPLQTLYFQCVQSKQRNLPERFIRMNGQGMVLAAMSRDQDGRMQEVSYSMPSILFWDALQFVTVSSSEKKAKFAFEPLDNDHSKNKENLYAALDKKYLFLRNMSHPPLFVCVLRRPSGVKALDLHAYMCGSAHEALGIVHALNMVRKFFFEEEAHESGVFGYSPFDNRNWKPAMEAKQPSKKKQNEQNRLSKKYGSTPSLSDEFSLFVSPRDIGGPIEPNLGAHKKSKELGRSSSNVSAFGRKLQPAAMDNSRRVHQLVQEDFLVGPSQEPSRRDYRAQRQNSRGRENNMFDSRPIPEEPDETALNRRQDQSQPNYFFGMPTSNGAKQASPSDRKSSIDALYGKVNKGNKSKAVSEKNVYENHSAINQSRASAQPQQVFQYPSENVSSESEQMNANSRIQPSNADPGNKPVAFVSPRKIMGVKVFPTMKLVNDDDREKRKSKIVASGHTPAQNKAEPASRRYPPYDDVKDTSSSQITSSSSSSERKNVQSSNAARPSNFEPQLRGLQGSRQERQSRAGNFLVPSYSQKKYDLTPEERKEDELAFDMRNIQFDDKPVNTISAKETDFEKSLGYLP